MTEKMTEARTFSCDAGKCDVTRVCVGEQEPEGFRLTVQRPYERPVKAFACKATHIRPAVEAVCEAPGTKVEFADEDAQPADVEPERGDDEEDGQDLSDTAVPLATTSTATDEDDDDPRTDAERDADAQFAASR